jgi:antitoxin FitA
VPSLSVKNVPEELLFRLRERARKHHRSLQKELLVILEESVQAEETTVESLHDYVRELRLSTPDEGTAVVRADRDAP